MKDYFKNRYFKNVFYICALTTAVLGTVFFGVTVWQSHVKEKKKRDTETWNTAQLMVQTMDEKFRAMELLATQIAGSSWYPHISSNSSILTQWVDYEQMNALKKEIGGYTDVLQVAKSVALVMPQKDEAVDRQSLWEIDRYFYYEGCDENLLQRIKEIMKNDTGGLQLLGNISEGNGNFCALKPIEYGATDKSILFVHIMEGPFRQYVLKNMQDVAEFAIYQKDELICLYKNKEMSQGKHKILTIPSSSYVWEYQFVIRQDTDAESFLSIWGLFFVYIGILLLVCMISFLIAMVVYRPIGRLMEKMGLNQQKELSKIGDVYLMLKEEKEGMENLANQYYWIGQKFFLESLLIGNFDRKEIGEIGKKFNTSFEDEMWFMVMLFSGSEAEEKELGELLIRAQLDCHYKNIIAAGQNYVGQSILIMADRKDAEQLAGQRDRIRVLMDEWAVCSDVEVFSGDCFYGLKGIRCSYDDAMEKMLRNKSPEEQLTYYLPFELEIRFNNYLRVGKFSDAEEILEQIQLENEKRQVKSEVVFKVVDILFEDMHRYAVDMNLSCIEEFKEYRKLVRNEEKEKLWTYLKNLLKVFHENSNKNYHTNVMGSKIVEYVKNNYSSCNLSQQGIADIFGVSRPIVSKIFKETAGMNFTDYLQKMRVEHAEKLIQDGATDLEQVAKACGYENSLTFKRAFMKQVGMSPRDYVRTRDRK